MMREEPVSPVTPEEAFAMNMTVHGYMKLGHGRKHNARYHEFRTLCVREIAAAVPDAQAPATRADIALLLASLYASNRPYSMNTEAQLRARAYADAVEAMGGSVFMGRGL